MEFKIYTTFINTFWHYLFHAFWLNGSSTTPTNLPNTNTVLHGSYMFQHCFHHSQGDLHQDLKLTGIQQITKVMHSTVFCEQNSIIKVWYIKTIKTVTFIMVFSLNMIKKFYVAIL